MLIFVEGANKDGKTVRSTGVAVNDNLNIFKAPNK
jgi:hypothetical protein